MADEEKKDPPPDDSKKKKPHEVPGDRQDDGNPWNDGDAPSFDEVTDWFEFVVAPRTEDDGDLKSAIMTETEDGILVRTTDKAGNQNVYFTDGQDMYFTSDTDAYNAPPDGLF
jgi:hypothetical protein